MRKITAVIYPFPKFSILAGIQQNSNTIIPWRECCAMTRGKPTDQNMGSFLHIKRIRYPEME